MGRPILENIPINVQHLISPTVEQRRNDNEIHKVDQFLASDQARETQGYTNESPPIDSEALGESNVCSKLKGVFAS